MTDQPRPLKFSPSTRSVSASGVRSLITQFDEKSAKANEGNPTTKRALPHSHSSGSPIGTLHTKKLQDLEVQVKHLQEANANLVKVNQSQKDEITKLLEIVAAQKLEIEKLQSQLASKLSTDSSELDQPAASLRDKTIKAKSGKRNVCPPFQITELILSDISPKKKCYTE